MAQVIYRLIPCTSWSKNHTCANELIRIFNQQFKLRPITNGNDTLNIVGVTVDARSLPSQNTHASSLSVYTKTSWKPDDRSHLECTTKWPFKNADLNRHAHPAHSNLTTRTLLNGGVSLCGTQRGDVLAGLSSFVPTCFSSALALTAVSFNEISLH